MSETLIEIKFTSADIHDMCDDAEIEDYAPALDRAREWASAIRDTATALINEQLENVVKYGQP